jgi:hypothetical protein
VGSNACPAFGALTCFTALCAKLAAYRAEEWYFFFLRMLVCPTFWSVPLVAALLWLLVSILFHLAVRERVVFYLKVTRIYVLKRVIYVSAGKALAMNVL